MRFTRCCEYLGAMDTMTGKTLENITRWYVIHTKPRQEDRADGNLRGQSIETFTPRVTEHRCNIFSGEPIYLIKYMFPCYIFARFKPCDSLHRIRYTRGVRNVVSFDNEPASIDDEVITLIKSRIGRDGLVKLDEEFKPGDELVIKEGPFKSLTGMFEKHVNGDARIVILLNSLNYQAHILVARAVVKRLNDS